MAAGDPSAWPCMLLLVGRLWKVGVILLAVIAVVAMITGFLTLWMKRWDI
jgi:hypothetical protein